MAQVPKCFVAYPSNIPGKGDAIESAVETLNAGAVVHATSWKSLAVSGRPIIGAICEEIRLSAILIADITNLNPNVLFELGYSIALRKRLFLIFNDQVAGAKVLFDRFQLLKTTGYAPYSNSDQIAGRFYADQPFSSLDKNLYDELSNAALAPVSQDGLLYIKPETSTEAVMRIARRVAGAPIPNTVDDPKEIGVQPLEWYLANVEASRGVICHFLSDDYLDVRISNAKGAFVAGIAYGFGKPLLMLAHSPYDSPIDYHDLLAVHHNAGQAESAYQAWLSKLLEGVKHKPGPQAQSSSTSAAHTGLLELNIGDPIAEYESENLPEYFIPTSAYAEALAGQHSIFVGRKGTGKTATLLKLSDELQSDPRNHICIIKPVDYELEGLIALLRQQLSVSEKGYLVESFWKALVYTELAKSVYEKIKMRHQFVSVTQGEQALIDFVERNEDLILPEFSMRLETLVERLTIPMAAADQIKKRVSEAVHRELLGTLRDLLLSSLEKSKTVAILVDNLDKNWTPRTNIQLVSELLFGLLSVGVRIGEEFKKSSLGKKRLDLAMTTFIRSDIYAAVVGFAREPDKLPIRRIEWSDKELLWRVIERRIMMARPEIADKDEVWTKFFVDKVEDIPTREFLMQSVFPRPRDLIFIVRASLQNAVNRGHTRIEGNDVASGVQKYSGYVLSSLMAEGTPQFHKLDDFITQLFGGPTILTEDDVREALESAGLAITNADFVVDLLQDLTFLSYETSPDTFVFGYEKDQKPKLVSMARKTVKVVGAKRYKIHPAFHAYLELRPTESDGQSSLTFRTSNRAVN